MTACVLCQQRHRTEQPLCGDCGTQVTVALHGAPALYVRGTQGVTAASHAMAEKLSTPKPGSRSPLRDGVWELCDSLARALAAWEADTIHAAGLPTVSALVRPGFSVQRSAATIAGHLTAALGPPYGVAHAGHVLAVTANLRDRLGLTLLVHQLAAPCPNCDTRALVRRDGDDHVSCRMCKQTWPEKHYALLTRLLVAESATRDTP